MCEQKNDKTEPVKADIKPSLGLKAKNAPGKGPDHVCNCGCGKK